MRKCRESLRVIFPKLASHLAVFDSPPPAGASSFRLTYQFSFATKSLKIYSGGTMKILTVLSSFILLFLLSTDVLANASSCVQCHTNEALMKSLHKPAVIAAGEEGEG